MTVDPKGGLLIAESIADAHAATSRSLVRRISAGRIDKFAGSGEPGYAWDQSSQGWAPRNRSANALSVASAFIGVVLSATVDAAGRIYVGVVDPLGPGRILVIDPGARDFRVLAGGTISGNLADGIPATTAPVFSPAAIAVMKDGQVLFADYADNRVRRIDTTGRIFTLAGTGAPAFAGDGGPGVAASLRHPSGIDVAASGDVLIADSGNDRIRRVRPDGRITTFAGTGVLGFSGDGGPAGAAQLQWPTDVRLDSAGNAYIADFANERVRLVDPNGQITTFAGTGVAGYSGDGGIATGARLAGPVSLAVSGGSLYVAESRNRVVRQIGLG